MSNTRTTYRPYYQLACPFCGTLTEVPTAEAAPPLEVGTVVCPYCEKSYRYIVDDDQPANFTHVVTLRESEYQAIRAN